MKKFVLPFCLFIVTALSSFAQKEANIWYFGGHAGLDFNSGSPVPLSNGQMSTIEGCASIADKTTGQLLFYTDGRSVWDKTHNIMPNGTGLKGSYSSTQSGVIVPMPGSTTKYYIFVVDAEAGSASYSSGYGGLTYNIVDMTLNGGKGDLSTKNFLMLTPTAEKITAVRACNGQDIWVITHKWNSNAFYAYRVSPGGIALPIISSVGITHQDVNFFNNAESIGYMKASPNGKKIALACYEALNTVQIFDFDNTTGAVSNPITDTNYPDNSFSGGDGPYGISFSPDNSKLYVGVYGDYSYFGISFVYQYNMNAGSNFAILNSRTTIETNYDESFGALQLGPDGKIYIAKSNDFGSHYLDVINNPNALGAACNYSADALYLGINDTSVFGLPDMIESFLSVPYTATLTYSDCGGSHTLSFTDNAINGSISTSWNFGDPSSGVSNTSSSQNPSHTFSSNGTYTVAVYFTTACQVDSFKQIITTAGGLAATLNPPYDTTICSGDYATLQAGGGTSYQWSPTTQAAGVINPTSATTAVMPTQTTTYTVTVSNGGCSATKTITVYVAYSPPVPTFVVSHDTVYCSFDTSYFSYQWFKGNTKLNGETNPWLKVTQDGNYNLSVTSKNGCSIAVGTTIILSVGTKNLINSSITLLPNPARDELTISGNLTGDKIRLLIYDVLGQMISSSEESSADALKRQIDVSGFSKGIYFVKIQQAEGSWTGKFVKD